MRIGRVAACVGLYVQEDPTLIYDGDAMYVLLPWVLVPLAIPHTPAIISL